MRVVATVVVIATAGAGPAVARELDYVIVEPTLDTARRGDVPDRLFLNRCAAGCTIVDRGNSVAEDRSTIPDGDSTLSPFSLGDDAWTQVVACVRETYAPYGVEVSDAEPAAGVAHVELMVAGFPQEIGQGDTTLGIAPLTSNCSPQVGVIGFAFANAHNPAALDELCATVAHEAGHIYGLDHAFTCKDPMTYLTGCESKRFLNLDLACGEFDGERACKCGGTQSSHAKLVAALDAGAVPPAGTATIMYPTEGLVLAPNATVFVAIAEPRTAIRVELWVNGARRSERATTIGAELVELSIPPSVSDGVLELEARVVNDLGQVASSSVRVTQVAACDQVPACASGEACDGDGRCVPSLGARADGEVCGADAECASQRCVERYGTCASSCVPVVAGQCPDDTTCVEVDDQVAWVCVSDAFLDDGGCCGADGRGGGSGACAGFVVAALARRRRRRAS